ncbi:hypothetical protein BDW72DRAFT_208940 [Aspergillus terricola var. indicus]
MAATSNPPCQVTGGASGTTTLTHPGIGKSIAHTYAQNGISALALADSHPHLANQIAIYTVNVTKEEEIAAAVQAAAQRFGRIDISIHGAGISGGFAHTHGLDLKEWQKVIDVNQTGVMLCDKWVVKQMLGQELIPEYRGRGIIVNISSVYGIVAPDGRMGIAPYAASKHGMSCYWIDIGCTINGYNGQDAKNYAKDDIRINAISPGYLEAGVFSPEIENTVLKRPAMPEKIADAVLLTSRMGSCISPTSVPLRFRIIHVE